MKIRGKALCLLVLFFFYTSLIPALKFRYWVLEVHNNLAGYYCFLSLFAALCLLLFGSFKKPFYAITFLLLLAFSGLVLLRVLPFFIPAKDVGGDHKDCCSFKLLTANVLTSNKHPELLQKLINKEKPDLIGLVELNNRWQKFLTLESTYPYKHEIVREDSFGVGVYSKFPFAGELLSDLGGEVQPVFMNKILLPDGSPFYFALVHSASPLSAQPLLSNALMLRRISTRLKHVELPVIIAGDLNAGPFSSFYGALLAWTGTRSAFDGRGLYKSWHSEHPLLYFQIDHVLFKGFEVRSASVGQYIGSDHFPLITEFQTVK